MDLRELLLADNVVDEIKNNLDDLLYIIPEIQYMIGFEHKHPHHHLDVWEHTLLALSLSKKDFDIRLSLLLHDIGKPFSFQDGEVRHFYRHAIVSAKMAKSILMRLHFDKDYVKYICSFIRYHDTPISDEQLICCYDWCLKLYEIQYCDALAHHPNQLDRRKEYLKKIKKKILLSNFNLVK